MQGGGGVEIVAIVSPSPDLVQPGSASLFIHEDPEVRKNIALTLAKLSRAAVHQVDGDIYVVARH